MEHPYYKCFNEKIIYTGGQKGEFPSKQRLITSGYFFPPEEWYPNFTIRTPLDVEQQIQGRPCIGTRRQGLT